MLLAAERPVIVEPDFEKNSPVFRVDSPVGAYWRTDMFGRVIHYAKRWYETAADLAVKFPEHANQILPPKKRTSGGYLLGEPASSTDTGFLEVAKIYTKEGEYLICPDRQLLLAHAPSILNRTPVFIAEMPKWDEESRGQFDEMIWVQVARARMAAYTMEVAHEAVNAPLVLPNDVNSLSIGPRSVIRTNNPQGIQRVPLDVPPAAFAENQLLAQEERLAARFPEGMTGNIDASVITGQGISALLSTVDTQVQVAQSLIAIMLQDAASYALELDQVVFGKMEKSAEGRADGKDYSIRYTPEKDIAGDYKVECTYGFASGMDANRGLIFMLQAQGAGLLSRETIMNQIASQFGISSSEEMARMDIESIDDALRQAMQGLAMSIPQLPQMGQDPRVAVRQIATLRDARQKGTPIHEAVMKAFEPTPEEQAAAEQQAQDPLAALMGGAQPGAPVSAGGAPPEEGSSLQMMLAGLTPSGQPNLQATLSRMIPAA